MERILLYDVFASFGRRSRWLIKRVSFVVVICILFMIIPHLESANLCFAPWNPKQGFRDWELFFDLNGELFFGWNG